MIGSKVYNKTSANVNADGAIGRSVNMVTQAADVGNIYYLIPLSE